MTTSGYAPLALCALALLLSACGEGTGTPPPAGAVEADAGTEVAAGEELFDTQFAQVCRDTGQSRAAEYVAGPGLHPVLVLRSGDGAEYYQAITTLPEGWNAQWPDLGRTELVVCARRTAATPVEVCEGYEDEDSGMAWTVQTHDVVYDYTLRVARTAEVLASETFEVPAGPCPMLSTYRQGDPQPQPYYPSVGDGEVELFVRPFVTGS